GGGGGGAGAGGGPGGGLTLGHSAGDRPRESGRRAPTGAGGAGGERGSPAGYAGVRPGDLLVEINRKPVASAADAERLLAASGESVLLLVRRGDGTIYLVVNKKG